VAPRLHRGSTNRRPNEPPTEGPMSASQHAGRAALATVVAFTGCIDRVDHDDVSAGGSGVRPIVEPPPQPDAGARWNQQRAVAPSPSSDIRMVRLANPERTRVTDTDGHWIATFTYGARTVTFAGPERTFADASATEPISSTTWVRVLPEPFDGTVDG